MLLEQRFEAAVREKNELAEQLKSLYSAQENLTRVIETQQRMLPSTVAPKPVDAGSPQIEVQEEIPRPLPPRPILPAAKPVAATPVLEPAAEELENADSLPSAGPFNVARVIIKNLEHDYLVLLLRNGTKVKEGTNMLLSKDGQPVYQVEVRSIYASNISTVKILKKLSESLDLSKGDVCEATPMATPT